jgi:hypothetical protein
VLLIVLMMEAASNSETSVNFYHTAWQKNPKDSHLHTHCHQNLKSHLLPSSSLHIIIISPHSTLNNICDRYNIIKLHWTNWPYKTIDLPAWQINLKGYKTSYHINLHIYIKQCKSDFHFEGPWKKFFCNFMAFLIMTLYANNQIVTLKQSLWFIIHCHLRKVSVSSKHLEWP